MAVPAEGASVALAGLAARAVENVKKATNIPQNIESHWVLISLAYRVFITIDLRF
jgi:hypothetical protein